MYRGLLRQEGLVTSNSMHLSLSIRHVSDYVGVSSTQVLTDPSLVGPTPPLVPQDKELQIPVTLSATSHSLTKMASPPIRWTTDENPVRTCNIFHQP